VNLFALRIVATDPALVHIHAVATKAMIMLNIFHLIGRFYFEILFRSFTDLSVSVVCLFVREVATMANVLPQKLATATKDIN